MNWNLFAQKSAKFALTFYALGIPRGLRYLYARARSVISGKDVVVRLKAPLAEYPLEARLGSSDLDVFFQAFIKREHRYTSARHPNPTWIIDCGANVGYTAAYFASKFKNATVVALEPDPRNFAILAKNVVNYGERIIAVEAGVWPVDGKVQLVTGEFGDGRDWASQTREPEEGCVADVRVLSVKSVMHKFSIDRVDILKIDIEGAEVNLFERRVSEWLPFVDQIAIELHGPDCSSAFYNALKKSNLLFEFRTCGELTIASRI